MKLINIGIAGCLGRMGKELVRKSIKDSRTNFIGGFERKTHELINKNLSEILNCETNHIVSDNPEEVFNNSDVIINFTVPECSVANIEFAEKTRTPLVIGTTGLTQEINDKINDVSNKVSILQSSNMSLSVNLLFKLVRVFSANSMLATLHSGTVKLIITSELLNTSSGLSLTM
jgi:4-hydroxy-tetrahydrodipicolinate reductase